MSQLVATQPASFFDKPRDFTYQGSLNSESSPFIMAQSSSGQKEIVTHDVGYDRQNQGRITSYNSFYQYTMSMYNMYSNMHTTFSTQFPRAQDYMSKESIIKAFPHLENVNDTGFDVDSIPSNAHFYILRSSNDDNVHKAIKYHQWSTTTGGKAILSNAWKEFEKEGVAPHIYLIFSVVNSNHVLGVAKMTSDVNDEETFMYWWEPLKWFGTFQIEWLFIKDIHCSKFEHIKEEESGSSSFINLKDCSKLSEESGKEVLRIFRDCIPKSDIFGSFAYMDQREDYLRLQRQNTYFLNYFEECCAAYKKNPEGFSPRKTQQNNRRGGRFGGNGSNYAGNRKPKSGYYQKTFYARRQQSSPDANNVNSPNKINQNSNEEFPPISLVEQFGLKSASKKNKTSKVKKVEKEAKEGDEKVNTSKEDNVTLTN